VTLKYFGADITSHRKLEEEAQTTKAVTMFGFLRDTEKLIRELEESRKAYNDSLKQERKQSSRKAL